MTIHLLEPVMTKEEFLESLSKHLPWLDNITLEPAPTDPQGKALPENTELFTGTVFNKIYIGAHINRFVSGFNLRGLATDLESQARIGLWARIEREFKEHKEKENKSYEAGKKLRAGGNNA